jgi:RNA polymerase sigma-70 factor (TIGR02943 family)
MKQTPPHPSERDSNEDQLDPQSWVDQHGDYLYRYAIGRVRRGEVAEDLVQETLLAAWKGRAQFAGRAKERSWLTAILKRKVIDWLRSTVKERNRIDVGDDWLDQQFSKGGKWKGQSNNWVSDAPTTESEQVEFWEALNGCADQLPTRLRDVFVLWHLDERESDEVCQALRVTPSNLWVMLHRARLRMWRCLSRNWYGLEPVDRKGRDDS